MGSLRWFWGAGGLFGVVGCSWNGGELVWGGLEVFGLCLVWLQTFRGSFRGLFWDTGGVFGVVLWCWESLQGDLGVSWNGRVWFRGVLWFLLCPRGHVQVSGGPWVVLEILGIKGVGLGGS